MRTTTRFTVIAIACLAVAGLAGCSAKSDSATTPTATKTVTTAPAPSTSTSTPPSPSTSSTPSTQPAILECTSANLTAAILNNAGGGAAGSTYVSLVLTNKGTTSCTLQGWPGVSFVGHGNGTQIGQAAAFDKTSPHPTVTLAPAGSAKSTLRIVQAGNYSAADCTPTKADGFRVYPPGQKASIFATKAGFTACAKTSVSLLTVSELTPGA
jgi:hypothetical protein